MPVKISINKFGWLTARLLCLLLFIIVLTGFTWTPVSKAFTYANLIYQAAQKRVSVYELRGIVPNKMTMPSNPDKVFDEYSIWGSQMIYIVKDVEKFEGEIIEPDQDLGILLYGYEWASLFYDVLGCPKGIDEPYMQGQDLDEWKDKYRKKFQGAIPNYPMLGRIRDIYVDVGFTPQEVKQLQKECLEILTKAANLEARSWLSKLIQACNIATQKGLGVFLAGD